MHHGGGGGGHSGGDGGGMNHGAHGHHHIGGTHGGENGGMTIRHLLGLGSGHGGGGGFLSGIQHALGLSGHHHGVGHHQHQASSTGAPDKSLSWNMASQVQQNPWQRFLNTKLKFTPALGFFCLFAGLTLWLGVVYHVRHHDPAEHFEQLSHQLYTRQLPSARGQMMVAAPGAGYAAQPTAVQGAGYAAQPAALQATGYAGQPAVQPVAYQAQPPISPTSTNNMAGYNMHPSMMAAPQVMANQASPGIANQGPPVLQQRMKVFINR
jgi:hypothetical protein